MSMKPNARDDFAEKVLETAGGGCFTAVIDNYRYYDENLDIKEFESGHLYFPSVLINALGVHEDISGESLFYQDMPGEPRFIHYKNMSYALSKEVTDADVTLEEPVKCVAEYNSYQELPEWMGLGKLKKTLEETKRKKECTLDKMLREMEYRSSQMMFRETVITTLVLFLQSVLIIPIIVEHSLFVRIGYFVPAFFILFRFSGRAVKLYIQYKNTERIYYKHTEEKK